MPQRKNKLKSDNTYKKVNAKKKHVNKQINARGNGRVRQSYQITQPEINFRVEIKNVNH